MSDASLLASRRRRFLATCIDFVVLPPIALVIMLATGLMEGPEAYVWPQPVLRLFGLLVVSYFAIHGYLLARRGQTLGKKLMGLRPVSTDSGTPLVLWQLAARAFAIPLALLLAILAHFTLAAIVALLLVADPLIALFGPKRSLHDYLVGSVVHNLDR